MNIRAFSLLMAPFFVISVAMGQGNNCANPVVVNALPYERTGLNTSATGDATDANPCSSTYMRGNDYWFRYTPANNEWVDVLVTNCGTNAGVFVFDGCPDAVGTQCVGFDGKNPAGSRTISKAYLKQGTSYVIVVSTSSPPQTTAFDLKIQVAAPPVNGSDCVVPYPIATLPFDHNGQQTSTYGDRLDGNGACFPQPYLNGDEVVYTYTPVNNELVKVLVSQLDGNFAGLGITDRCPTEAGAQCVASVYNEVSNAALLLENVSLKAGKTYYLTLSTWENPQSVQYRLQVERMQDCKGVNSINTMKATSNSLELEWDGASDRFEYQLLPAGGTPAATGTMYEGSRLKLNGLQTETAYDLYVNHYCNASPLMLTAVFDGPLTGGQPRGVELYVSEDIADLSQYGIGVANDGGGTDGMEFQFPSRSLAKGTWLYVSSESTLFQQFFGFAPDYTTAVMNGNGNDAIELFRKNVVVDRLGDPSQDGTGKAWEYTDGWLYRKPGNRAEANFNVAQWQVGGINNLEGGSTNASCDVPVPVKTMQMVPLLESGWMGPFMVNTKPIAPSCGGLFKDSGGSSRAYTNNERDTTVICPGVAGNLVRVQFNAFEVQAQGNQCLDQLVVFNGPDVLSPRIQPVGADGWCWSGNGGSGNLGGQVLQSTHASGCLTFVFLSDASVALSGWDASVQCVSPSCTPPTGIQVTDLTGTTAKVNWNTTATGNPTTKVAWGYGNFVPAQAPNVGTVNDPPFQFSNLQPLTTYTYYIQDVCGGSNSEWTGPYYFTTLCTSSIGDRFEAPIEIPGLPYSSKGDTRQCYANQVANASNDVFYAFTTGACQYSVRITTCSPVTDFDTFLMLYDEQGNVVLSNNDAGTGKCTINAGSGNVVSTIDLLVQPNTRYVFHLEGFGAKSGNYEVSVTTGTTPIFQTGETVNQISCPGTQSGSIRLQPSGGAGSYQYLWNTGSKTNELSSLGAGTYTVTITDGCGNAQVVSYVLAAPADWCVNAQVTPTQNGQATGSITWSICGVPNGAAQVSLPQGLTYPSAFGLSAGTYCITLTDAKGCTREDCRTVSTSTATGQMADWSWSIYPNPSTGDMYFESSGEFPGGTLQYQLYGCDGKCYMAGDLGHRGQGEVNALPLGDLSPGVYFLALRGAGYREIVRLVRL